MKKESFTKQFAELEALTEKFERGEFDLDEGLKEFERGLTLASALKKRLADVEQKVEVIKKKFGNQAENADETERASEQKQSDTLPF